MIDIVEPDDMDIVEPDDFELKIKKKALVKCDQLRKEIAELQDVLRSQIASRISGDVCDVRSMFYAWAEIDSATADIILSNNALDSYNQQLHNCFLEITRVSSEEA